MCCVCTISTLTAPLSPVKQHSINLKQWQSSDWEMSHLEGVELTVNILSLLFPEKTRSLCLRISGWPASQEILPLVETIGNADTGLESEQVPV